MPPVIDMPTYRVVVTEPDRTQHIYLTHIAETDVEARHNVAIEFKRDYGHDRATKASYKATKAEQHI